MFNLIVFSIVSLIALSTHAQKDPLKDFCRLFGHQTTVVDRRQYIDGGFVNWSPLSAGSTNYTSTWMRAGKFDEINEGFPQHTVLAKNESTPTVHGGVLWADSANKLIYQYGGAYGNDKPEDFKLWYYDIIYDSWNISSADTRDIKRASWGAGAVAQDKGVGFYYGGWLTGSSVPGYSGKTALKSMLVYDMLSNKFRNQTGPDDTPRAEGSMLYLPAGDAGVLIYFGGLELPYGNATERGANMSDIYIFDIGGNRWYSQKATGEVPEQRRRFCAGATWVEDRSSYNIYLYGGASVGDGVGYGDVYVLSLPSFKWIKFWPTAEESAGETYPHHSLSCDVLDNTQMIIMGGHFTNSSDCDVPRIYGQHGLDLGQQNNLNAKWHVYNSSLTKYQVPPVITKVIGGGPNGGATLLAPTNGWGSRDLQVQFQRSYTPGVRDATRPIPKAGSPTPSGSPGGSNQEAVIGGAIGGTIGGLLIASAVGVFIFMRRKNKKQEEFHEEVPKSSGPPSELPGEDPKAAVAHAYPASVGSPPPMSATWAKSPAMPGYPGSPDTSLGATDRASKMAFYHASSEPGDQLRQPEANFTYEMPAERSPTAERFEMPGIGISKEKAALQAVPPAMDPYYVQTPPAGPSSRSVRSARSVKSFKSPVTSPLSATEPYFSQNPPQEGPRKLPREPPPNFI